MKQIAQNYKSGELFVLDVPPPVCKPGGVLVRSCYSLISTGTEMMKVGEAKLSLVGKARARPDQVRKVIDAAAQLGPAEAYRRAVTRLDSFTPLGYSLSGIVEEVGPGAEEFAVGDLVACAGNEHALHAELNWIPVNLCVAVAPTVPAEHAAFATVGAIAMQAVRRAEVQLGESACVIGLGLVGQLAVQLLVAAGIRVVGVDPVEQRCRLAEASGALLCAPPDEAGVLRIEGQLDDGSGSVGADHVFIAAGGTSNNPVELAARLARDRARVTDIGKCRLDLPWNAYYDKELDVRFSRSYGPGRYDDRYELEGVDYPAGYVRWTERRNLACFVDLLERGLLPVDLLVSGRFPIDEATDVYQRIADHQLDGIGLLFEYAAAADPAPTVTPRITARPATRSEPAPIRLRSAKRTLRVGFIGAGNYATSMLLPALRDDERVELARVATARSLSAANAQRRFGFTEASIGAESVVDDTTIDVVFIATRHRMHADLVCRALETGKSVFVEKPLALNEEELARVVETVDASGNDRLMVGFNRRFAPLFVTMRDRFGRERSPGTARYVVNAGRLERGSWYLNQEFEGSRFVGEGGHFVDTLSWWFGALPLQVQAAGTDGNVVATLTFDDGSIGSISYTADGNARFPKEVFEASGGGRSARLSNFKAATVWRGRRRLVERSLLKVDKGQRNEVDSFVRAIAAGDPMPIPFESLVATTRATLVVARALVTGQSEKL